jgi:two-component system, NarL family, response regulator NreC
MRELPLKELASGQTDVAAGSNDRSIGERQAVGIQVLLVDDHAVLRDALGFLLEAQGGIRVVGNAANGRDAVRKVKELKPDVVVMDIAMPDLSGVEATQQIREVRPATRVLILSMYSSTEHVRQALRAGAHGYLLKKSAGSEVADAVRVIHGGGSYLSSEIAGVVINDYIADPHAATPLDLLTHRERQILKLIAEGKSSAEAASSLFLSRTTVDTYRSRLMNKLGIRDLHGLIKFAVDHGLTTFD